MRWFNRLRRWPSGSEPVTSWIIALALFALVVLVYLILLLQTLPEVPKYLRRWPEVVVAAWDLAVLSLLVLPWRTILSSNSKDTGQRAAKEDPGEVDELVCLEAPPDLGAIGFWYRDFAQTQDEEVIELLERAQRAEPERGDAGPDRKTGCCAGTG
jgi:hypothetical protein